MVKIVINSCYGVFNLSNEAMLAYTARKSIATYCEDYKNFMTIFWKIPIPDRNIVGEKIYYELYKDNVISAHKIKRDDPDLVAVVEQLGSKKAGGTCSKLSVVEIPDDVDWVIDGYDGYESIEEVHRSWG